LRIAQIALIGPEAIYIKNIIFIDSIGYRYIKDANKTRATSTLKDIPLVCDSFFKEKYLILLTIRSATTKDTTSATGSKNTILYLLSNSEIETKAKAADGIGKPINKLESIE
jgi:hypothetical protein